MATDRDRMNADMEAAIRAGQTQIADAHLAHDFGWRATHYIKQTLGEERVRDAVIDQRNRHYHQETLYTEVNGERKLTGKIDLARLGLNKAQIAEVNRLKEIELNEGLAKPGFAAAVGGPKSPIDRGNAKGAGPDSMQTLY